MPLTSVVKAKEAHAASYSTAFVFLVHGRLSLDSHIKTHFLFSFLVPKIPAPDVHTPMILSLDERDL